jgi:hypothetical protein
MKPQNRLHLDDGRFPELNMQKTCARGRCAIQRKRFGPPVMNEERARGIYNVVHDMDSLREVTLAFRDNRKFI